MPHAKADWSFNIWQNHNSNRIADAEIRDGMISSKRINPA